MILRRIKDVETIDVGKPFGMPDGAMLIQWIISNEVGDDRYQHRFAIRKYTVKPADPSKIPFHNHKYIQCLTVLSGRLLCETPDEAIEVGPWESAYFYENESHKAVPIGNEIVEMICVIDCPDDGENCFPEIPSNIAMK
jgi:mannose-6-phosphate isomerase-like protein (cupin superfamily)